MERPNSTIPRRRASGFSLVEITMAIGIMAFALVAIYGLLPVGLNIARQAIDTSVGSQITQRVISEAQETDFTSLVSSASGPGGGLEAERFFDEQGNELTSSNGAIYHVRTRIVPATSLPGTTANDGLATITVQVANNPGNRPLAANANLLWTGAPSGSAGGGSVPLSTFSSFVARN